MKCRLYWQWPANSSSQLESHLSRSLWKHPKGGALRGFRMTFPSSLRHPHFCGFVALPSRLPFRKSPTGRRCVSTDWCCSAWTLANQNAKVNTQRNRKEQLNLIIVKIEHDAIKCLGQTAEFSFHLTFNEHLRSGNQWASAMKTNASIGGMT